MRKGFVRFLSFLVENFLLTTSILGKKMMTYLRNQVGPSWFQELSKPQIAAADSLFTAVSDETEQCQYQRCREVLSSIGLSPLPKKSDVIAAIRFSRNNDLAFLWFLYKSFFHPCEDIATRKCFSLNERLILSSICHLDMMTTLRELDRILPKPAVKLTKRTVISTPRKPLTYECPYDEPVPKPKLQPERCYAPPQRQHPKFELYRRYKDPSFVIENESNRWYAEQRLLPPEAKNIAKEIICEEISKVTDLSFDHDMIMNGLCSMHREEASKFNQLLMKALNKPSEVSLKDCDSFERGVFKGVLLELAKTEEEFRNETGQAEKAIEMKTTLEKIAGDAADIKYMHLCENCEKCVRSKELCCKIIKREQSLINSKSKENIEPPNDENRIKFFQCPSSASPFEFDYEKIYATNFLNDCGVVRNSINIALGLNKHLTEDNAITVCLKDMWNSQLKEFNKKRQREWEEKQQHVVADCDKIGKNKQKIFRLLSKGIALMRRNPKYVLVSLPDADRLPILREWILHRFGVRYDIKDIEKRWKINKFHRDRLNLAGPVPIVKVPDFTVLGIKTHHVPLDGALKKRKKVNFQLSILEFRILNVSQQRDEWVRTYYKRLASGTIEKSRLSWVTMEPYMCNTERMREIFYAYMPARDFDFDRVIMNKYF